MKPDDQNRYLQTLFDKSQDELDGAVFTEQVMTQVRNRRIRIVSIIFSIILVLTALVWLFALPFQEFAQLIMQAFTITLFDLGDSWLAWVFAPVNNIASLLVLTIKAIRVIRKKAIGSY